MPKNLTLIAALDQNNGIGFQNQIPWNIPEELSHFHKTTCDSPPGTQNAVIMGRKTWDSIPKQHKPFKERINIVLSRNPNWRTKAEQASSLEEAIQIAKQNRTLNSIYIIGGAETYEQALSLAETKTLILSRIEKIYDCDTFFPNFDHLNFQLNQSTKIQSQNGPNFTIETYLKQ